MTALADVSVDFETFADEEQIVNQIDGVTVSGASVLTAGVSLNELEFPPRSGNRSLARADGRITFQFDEPISQFLGFFTYLGRVTIEARNDRGDVIATRLGQYGTNTAASGPPGSFPNERIDIQSRGITEIVISTANNLAVTIDDLSFELEATPGAADVRVTPSRLALSYTVGGAPVPPRSVAVRVDPRGPLVLSSSAGWLRAEAPRAVRLNSEVAIHVAASGLEPGSHVGDITFSSGGGSARLRVVLEVKDRPELFANPAGPLRFSYQAGGAAPAPKYFTLLSRSSFASIEVSPEQNWITAAASSQTTPARLEVTVDPAGLGVGEHAGSILVSAPQATNSPYRIGVILSVRGTGLTAPGALVNGATFEAGPVAPGSLVTIFWNSPDTASLAASELPLPFELGGVSASVNGLPLALSYVGPAQVNGQLPYALAPGPATVTVRAGGEERARAELEVAEAAPGIFVVADGHAAALNQDGSVNSADNGAAPGEVVAAFLTGQGLLDVEVALGEASPSGPLALPRLPVSATLDGQPVTVHFAGLAPGLVALLQLNLEIPQLPPGRYLLVVTIGGRASNSAWLTVGG